MVQALELTRGCDAHGPGMDEAAEMRKRPVFIVAADRAIAGVDRDHAAAGAAAAPMRTMVLVERQLPQNQDRTSVDWGRSVAGSVDLGWCWWIEKKNKNR